MDERCLKMPLNLFWEGEADASESSVGRLAVGCQLKVPRVIGGFTVYAFLGYEKGIIK